jgi:hypothetical protein
MDEHEAMSAIDLPVLDELRWSDSPAPPYAGATCVDVLDLNEARTQRRRRGGDNASKHVREARQLARTVLQLEAEGKRRHEEDRGSRPPDAPRSSATAREDAVVS